MLNSKQFSAIGQYLAKSSNIKKIKYRSIYMFEKTSIGEWVVLALSLIIALISTFSKPIYESGSYVAGSFIGLFIVSLIILYVVYWIITKVYPKSENWGIILWILAIVGITIIIVIVLAVVVAFFFGMAGPTYNAPVYSPIPTIVPQTTIINAVGNSGWVYYSNNDDHFSIYKPSDWIVKEFTMSELSSVLSSKDAEKIDKSALNKVVYIYSPSYTGYITIYGNDFSGTLISIFNDPGKTQISNEFYDSAVGAMESSSASSKDTTLQMKVISVEKDNNYYMINGNPARRMVVHWEANGQSLSGDGYIIAHGNAYYMEFYSAMNGSTQSDASTASNIMRTFTTTI